MKIIVIDTETTGLPERDASIYDVAKWPHIIQISWAIYDENEEKVIKEYNAIISLGTNIPIPDESVAIHGITREMSLSQGIPISAALFDLKMDMSQCERVVAHNLSFDKRMIMVESKRNRVYLDFCKNEYCTMKNSVDLCKLEKKTYALPETNINNNNNTNASTNIAPSPETTTTTTTTTTTPRSQYKLPKLVELYAFLYPDEPIPDNLHNSKVDVEICLRCYIALMEMKKKVD